MSNHLVFVYGSLCSGLSNSSLLVRGGARLLGIGKTIDRYDMYDLGMFPGVVENDEGKQILGELYVVSEELLRALDSLEGCPHFYQRKVKKITFVSDCGIVVHPDQARAQLMGGVVYGLGAALGNAITIENGRVQQSNFNNYPSLRQNEVPIIEVHLIPSQEKPGGLGEVGVPLVAPALANAIAAATGKRIRELPVKA